MNGWRITFGVSLVHFLILGFLVFQHIFQKQQKTSPIAIRTVALVLSEQSPKNPAPFKPSSSAPVKKEQLIASKKQTSSLKKEKSIPDTQTIHHIEQIAAAFKSFSAPSSAAPAKPLEVPTPIAPLSSKEANDYVSMLIAFLQTELELPETGAVKLCLRLSAFGELLDLNILETRSKKNADYLKNRLPHLLFPCFNEPEGGARPQEWTITFQNAKTPDTNR